MPPFAPDVKAAILVDQNFLKKILKSSPLGIKVLNLFSFKFCAENIWPVNQYGRLLTWLQNWITKPTLEHLAPLTT